MRTGIFNEKRGHQYRTPSNFAITHVYSPSKLGATTSGVVSLTRFLLTTFFFITTGNGALFVGGLPLLLGASFSETSGSEAELEGALRVFPPFPFVLVVPLPFDSFPVFKSTLAAFAFALTFSTFSIPGATFFRIAALGTTPFARASASLKSAPSPKSSPP